MCCGKRAQVNRHSTKFNNPVSAGASYTMCSKEEKGVNTLISVVSNLALNTAATQPRPTNQVPVYPDEDYKIDTQELPPSYERVMNQAGPDVVTREMTGSTYSTMTQQTNLPSEYQTSSPEVSKLVINLTTALTSYQAGTGRRWHVRKAQRALRNQLYEEEVTRREASYGRLRCGERCEIWREIKAIDFGF